MDRTSQYSCRQRCRRAAPGCSHWLAQTRHQLKYRLALIVAGECVLRYDNEAGKGDHRHLGDIETIYAFGSYEKLLADFWADIETRRQQR